MNEHSHISYSKCYKPKDDPQSLLPEYWVWYLENRDKTKQHVNYRQFYKTANEHK